MKQILFGSVLALTILVPRLAWPNEELWVIEQRGCAACEEFRQYVLPGYVKAFIRDSNPLPVIRIKDADDDRREVMSRQIKRLWFATPAFIIVNKSGDYIADARAIHPDFYRLDNFLEDIRSEMEK
jgi:hypothetical protein